MFRAVLFQGKQTLDARSQPETAKRSPDCAWRDDEPLDRQLDSGTVIAVTCIGKQSC
jgi:hypothetical protein